jgi:hypothetical protein
MSLKPIYSLLNIDNKLTKKRIRSQREYNSFEDNIRLEKNCNYMSDILFLPTAKYGFKYLLIVLDIATRQFDCEKLKNKDSTTVLKAFKKICDKSDYLTIPKYSLITDSGSEFKGIFQNYLYNDSIFHKTIMKGNHTAMSPIDNLCYQLGKILNDYMSSVELQTGKVYRQWPDIIDTVIIEMNKIRKRELPDKNEFDTRFVNDIKQIRKVIYTTTKVAVGEPGNKKTGEKIETIEQEFIKPKFRVGQLVYVLLKTPKNILGKNQSTLNFRAGDMTVDPERREITEVLMMHGKGPLYRYLVDGYRFVSFSESQLRLRL